MDMDRAVIAFSALGQPTRLAVFRLLIRSGPGGMAAGRIGAELDVLPNTLSANLSLLSRAGLVRSTREGRSIRYFCDLDGLRGLLAFLLEDCCGGRSELCQPLIDDIACAC